MTSPPVKATEALEKPPTAKPLRCRWFPEDDPKLRVNASYKKVPRKFLIKNEPSFCIFGKYFIPVRDG